MLLIIKDFFHKDHKGGKSKWKTKGKEKRKFRHLQNSSSYELLLKIEM